MELVNDSSHDMQHLGLSSIGHITVVVNQNRLEERRDHVRVDHVNIVGFLHVGVDQFQDFLFDRAKATDLGGLGGDCA